MKLSFDLDLVLDSFEVEFVVKKGTYHKVYITENNKEEVLEKLNSGEYEIYYMGLDGFRGDVVYMNYSNVKESKD